MGKWLQQQQPSQHSPGFAAPVTDSELRIRLAAVYLFVRFLFISSVFLSYAFFFFTPFCSCLFPLSLPCFPSFFLVCLFFLLFFGVSLCSFFVSVVFLCSRCFSCSFPWFSFSFLLAVLSVFFVLFLSCLSRHEITLKSTTWDFVVTETATRRLTSCLYL